MSYGMILVCAAASFASTLSAFVFAARQMGWPYGSLFDGKVPTQLALICFAFLLGRILMAIANDQLSILAALIPVPFAFFGSMIVHALLRQHSGMVSLVAAPLLTATTLFMEI